MIDGVEIQKGWINVSKKFNDTYSNDSKYGVDSNLENSVLLDLQIDDNLKQMGIAREIVNKVQKLRKSAGLNIDD